MTRFFLKINVSANIVETTKLKITRLPSAVETGKKGIDQTKVETGIEVGPVQEIVIEDLDPDRGIEIIGVRDPVQDLGKGHLDPEGRIEIVIDILPEEEIEVEIEIQADVIVTVIVIIVVIVTVIETVVIVLLKGN